MNAQSPATYVSLPQHALTPAPLAPPTAPQPSMHTVTVTRVRWGRIIVVIAGTLLLAFASMNIAHVGLGNGASSNARIAGATPVEAIAPTTATNATPAVASAAPKTPIARPRATSTHRATARRTARSTRAKRAAALTAQRRARATAAVTSGGGAAAGDALPYTGAETWIAALLGIALLALGIALQVNAVRLGMAALLYRRGILLRPVDCARLASERGLPQVRILVSNLIERLLTPPAHTSAFASSRHV